MNEDPVKDSPQQFTKAKRNFCSICQTQISDGEQIVECPECLSAYHDNCWEYNKGCGMYGCSHAPSTEKLNTLEMPMSYWGKEQKNCPACNREIQAAAIRCRYCGATFQSAQPEDLTSYHNQATLARNLPGVQRGAILLMVFSILPCTALPAAVFGCVWYFRHKREIVKLSALYTALCKLALGVAVVQSTFILVAVALHTMLRG